MGKKVTSLMDTQFQLDHRAAFSQQCTELSVGDVVFMIDHYWPGIIVADVTGQCTTWKVETRFLLDGIHTMTYNSRQLRLAKEWDVPTAEEADAILKSMD